jgi:hypothetical protein
VADVGHGAVLVVREAFHHQGHPGRTVAFQDHLFQSGAAAAAFAALNGPGDIVIGHIFGPGRGDGGSEARIAGEVTASQARRHGDFFGQLAEEFPPFGVRSAFFPLDRAPLGMTRHLGRLLPDSYQFHFRIHR